MNSGIVAGLFTGMQVGAALFLSQLVVADVGVGLLGFMRYGIALLCLAPLLLVRKTPAITRADWPKIALLGMGQVAVMISLLNLAVLFTSAARVALIFATLPAISLCIDKLKGEVSGNWLSNLGIALSIGGVAVLVGHDAFSAALTAAQIIGMGAAFAATVVVATCSSMYRPYVVRYGSAKISVIGFSVSLAPLAALAMLSPSGTAFPQWHPAIAWLVLAIGISSGVGYLTWFHALARLPATRVTGFLALNPVTAAVLSLIFTGAHLTPTLLLSVCLVCAGIACFALSPQPISPAPDAPPPA